MKQKVFLLTLATMLFIVNAVYGECPEGSNWLASWTDYWGNTTYTLQAPCKVYIGESFNITATVTEANPYCQNNWIGSFWAIIDNDEVINGCIDCQNSIWVVDGQWQRIITRTYEGTPIDHLIKFQFKDHGECSGFHHAEGSVIGNITVDPYPVISYSCIGFETPLDKSPIKFKKNRVLPLKARLNNDGSYITNTDITAPPVVQVLYNSGVGGDPIDISDDVLSAGNGTVGNQFVFTDEGKWQFNLQTKNYTALGTYSVSMETGNSSEYAITPTCSVDFIVE
ncbi:MAG: hypothetical protein WA126_02905 [Thermodesulfovibrionales bacterium]